MDAKYLIVIEDDASILEAVAELLSQRNYVVAGRARNLTDALQLITNIFFDCAVVDLKLFGETVAPLIRQLQSTHTPYVLISGMLPEEISPPWLRELPLLLKSFDGSQLISAIALAMTSSQDEGLR